MSDNTNFSDRIGETPFIDGWIQPKIDGWIQPKIDGWIRPKIDGSIRPYFHGPLRRFATRIRPGYNLFEVNNQPKTYFEESEIETSEN